MAPEKTRVFSGAAFGKAREEECAWKRKNRKVRWSPAWAFRGRSLRPSALGLLALSGGLMDAYSYLFRGEVFANAQTGNILLMSVYLSQGNWRLALQYAFPVTAFAIGILMAFLIRHWFWARNSPFHWRQLGVLVEIFLLALVAFLPQEVNLLANSLISLACGFQVEAFRKIHGNSIATTMCIGNLRAGIHATAEFCVSSGGRTATGPLPILL